MNNTSGFNKRNVIGNRTASESGRSFDAATREPAALEYAYATDTGQLLDDGLFSYSYDANGSLAAKTSNVDGSATRYAYDVYDRLARVEKYGPAGATQPFSVISYTYDWAGRRIAKDVDGVVTRYAWRGQNLVAEFDAAGRLLASWRHEPAALDRPVAMIRREGFDQPGGGVSGHSSASVFFYHYDERGSVIYLTNSDGHIVQRYEYDAFGRIAYQAGDIPNPFTYTGRQWDPEAGLYHYRARAYDPGAGAYTAVIYPHTITDGPHTVTAVAFDTAGNWSDPAAPGTSIDIIVDNVVPNPPINLTATENPDGTVTLTWEPPTTNEDGSPLTDLSGYNLYMVSEQNRCESIYPVSGDTTPLVCEPGSSQGTFTIDGPTLSFDNIDYNNTPFGTTAVWLDTNTPGTPFTPLPLIDSTVVNPEIPILVHLLELHYKDPATGANDETTHRITVYGQHTLSEIESWLEDSIYTGTVTQSSKPHAHALGCSRGETDYIPQQIPLSSITSLRYEKINVAAIEENFYIYNGAQGATATIIIKAVDSSGNPGEYSNIARNE